MKQDMRIKIFVLVAVLVLTTFAPMFSVYTADVVNNWLMFKRDGKTSTQITLVEGRGVDLVYSQPSNLYLSRLIIRDSSNVEVSTDTVWINEANNTLNAALGASGVYSVVGDYYTLNATGDAVFYYHYDPEKPAEAVKTAARVQSDKNNLIKQDSTISITANAVPSGIPAFSIQANSATGAFAEFDTVVSSKGIFKDNEWYYNLTFKKGTNSLTISLIAPYEITPQSEFEIDFKTQKSDALIVSIKSKEAMVEDIISALNNPEQRAPYMTFSAYNNLDYVTEDFKLIKKAVVYGVEVNFEWEWNKAKGVETNPAISISNPLLSTHYNAKVTRKDDDEEGVLTAHINYQPAGATEGHNVDHDLRVVVKGKGTPPKVRIVTKTDGQGEPEETAAIGTGTVWLDLYDGSVPGHDMRTGAYHPLFLQMNYGSRGGRADYVTVASSNANILTANYTGTTAGSYQDLYSWNSKLDNPNSNENIEGLRGLKLYPKQVGTTVITVRYYASAATSEVLLSEVKFNAQVVDSSPNSDSSLKSLELFELDKENHSAAITALNFKPATQSYALSLGNWVQKIRIRATKNDTKASSDITVKRDGVELGTIRSGVLSDGFDIVLEEDPEKMTFNFELIVTAENTTQTVYKIFIERMPQSNDTSLTDLVVKDKKGNVLPYFHVGNSKNTKFDQNVRDYGMEIAYNIKDITIAATTAHVKSTVTIDPEPQTSGGLFDPNKYISFADDLTTQLITVTITAEDGSKSEYRLTVVRMAPASDSLLQSLTIKDHTTKTVDFFFDPYVSSYETVEVDNSVRFVTLYPTPRSAFATMTIDGEEVTAATGRRVDLSEGAKASVSVKVTAEDGKTVTAYALSIKRLPPSTDATLSGLTVGSLTLTPIFSSSQTAYTATADEKATAVSVTPTTTHKNATVTVNGMPVRSGTASSSIPLAEESTVTVVVTAEDKATKKTYTVKIKNDALRVRGTNADLKNLAVNEGDMSPIFKSSITTYNVPVDASVDYIDILPVAADSRAKVEVKLGSKYIGDYSGNYSEALKNGNNKFTIEVTADDGKTKKSYTLTVNRSTSGQSNGTNPIGLDQVDFKKSKTIYIDITKYAVVSSDIFKELEKYPDTVVIFQGLDYSLTFKGSDISKIIPFAETYNLSMSFTSPNEDTILSMLNESDAARRLVFLYFKHHGVLPAVGTLRVDLGLRYKNDTLYLHYYNPEMDRIEYYGKVKANARGSIAFTVDHFSDYILAGKRLNGSVDKSKEVNIGVSDAQKVNPDTGR